MGVNLLAAVDVEYLKEESNCCDSSSDYVLQKVLLSVNQNNVHINCEEVCIDLQEVELNLVIDHLGRTVVEVEVVFVFDVVIGQGNQNKEQNHRDVKPKESHKGPEFEKYNHLELDRKARILHVLVKYFLTGIGFVLVLNFFLIFVPAAVEKVEVSQDYLHYYS